MTRITSTALKLRTACQVCGDALCGTLVWCPRCETAHHADCWTYAGMCSTYGCQFRGEPRTVVPARSPLRIVWHSRNLRTLAVIGLLLLTVRLALNVALPEPRAPRLSARAVRGVSTASWRPAERAARPFTTERPARPALTTAPRPSTECGLRTMGGRRVLFRRSDPADVCWVLAGAREGWVQVPVASLAVH